MRRASSTRVRGFGATASANSTPLSDAQYTVPSTTIGVDSDLPLIGNCHCGCPVALSTAWTVPEKSANNSDGPATVSEENTAPRVLNRQRVAPITASAASTN